MYKKKEILKVNNISKNFNSNPILTGINFSVNKGDVIGIIGNNGCGKTTLLKIIMGLIYPDEGTITISGKEISPGILGNLPTNIGALIEVPTFLPQISGIKNLSLLASIRNNININDIKNVMKRLGLDPNNKQSINKYSLGMKQKLGIAQAIMENPDLVLFDEPTNSLDSNSIKIFHDIIIKMKNNGCSFVLVSHKQDEINSLCDKVYQIDNTRLINVKHETDKE